MGIGLKIKEYRNKKGLTQKELADALHVTYQAVSRWENDDAEPSFETLKEMCQLLGCTTDDLFEIEKKNAESESTKIIEKVIVQEPQKPILAVCEDCKKPIYDSNDITTITSGLGRGQTQKIVCKECDQLRKERIEKQRKNDMKKARIHSFIWSTLGFLVFLVVAIIQFVQKNSTNGWINIVLAVGSFTFIATMILDNTFIPDLWMSVSSWGFVRLPGIIFSLSFNGLIFLIVAKVILWALGLLLALLSTLLATALAMGLSVLVYPFAIAKNFKNID